MKIMHKGPASEKNAPTYKFECRHCKSILKAKSYELRPFGYKNDTEEKNRGYVFTCPVCNVQRVVRKNDLTRVVTVREKMDKILDKVVKEIEKKSDRDVVDFDQFDYIMANAAVRKDG